MLQPLGYIPRIIDKKIRKYLSLFGAVCVEGPKWCGKTWAALNQSESVFYLANPEHNFSNRELARTDLSMVLSGKNPHLIDEWQEVPEIWDAVRFAVDERGTTGLFLLTGSSTPNQKGILHNGAGRISTVKMQTMSLYESGQSSGLVSLMSLFDSSFRNVITGDVDLSFLVYLCVRGGWPQNIGVATEDAGIIPHAYLHSVIENDYQNLSGISFTRHKMRVLLHSLARNESTVVTNTTLLKDMRDYDDTVMERPTLSKYLDILLRLFLIYEQPSYNPHLRSSRRILKSPKRHFSDPSLAVAALSATPEMLLKDLNTFGFIFESLCEHDLLIYADALNGSLYHYRDEKGNEIDAVVELPDGRWGAFEIKLGAHQIEEAAVRLIKIKRIIEREEGVCPAFLCIICGMTNAAYRRKDGVYVVPITALKD